MRLLKIVVITCLLLLSFSIRAAEFDWQTIAPGLEYSDVLFLGGGPNRGIHVFRIDLSHYQFRSAFAKDLAHGVKRTGVANLVLANNAVLGVNGGFFSPDLIPLGLRINQGQIIYPLKATSWWGVFYTQGSSAFITTPKAYVHDGATDFAVQSGPRLIVNNVISNLKPGMANRTALGITQDGKVILLVTEDFPISTNELARFMYNELNCNNAINLDGGSSTQLFALTNDFQLDIPSFSPITDAVVLVPRQNM